MKKAFLIWALFIPLGILNGGLREKILAPLTGAYALPVSGITLSLLILAITFYFIPIFKKQHRTFYMSLGLLWVVLTVMFEFALGLFVSHKTIADLLRAYDPTTGNLWLLVVIVVGVAPLAMAKVRHLI